MPPEMMISKQEKITERAFNKADEALTELTKAFDHTMSALGVIDSQIEALKNQREMLSERKHQLDKAIGKMVEALYPMGERQLTLNFEESPDA